MTIQQALAIIHQNLKTPLNCIIVLKVRSTFVVAVSKNETHEAIIEPIKLGQKAFGENYVQGRHR